MSTNTRNTRQPNESQTTTAAQSTPADADADAASAEMPDPNPGPDAAGSWVAQCQHQFDAGRTDRLPNLADETNQAIP